MTPTRVRYINTMSGEERAVRNALSTQRKILKRMKQAVSTFSDFIKRVKNIDDCYFRDENVESELGALLTAALIEEYETRRQFIEAVKRTKTIIKALKKQLPTPYEIEEDLLMDISVCMNCGKPSERYGNYCPYCGQKWGKECE